MFTNKRNLYHSSTSIIHVPFILHPNQEKSPKKEKNRVVYVTSLKFQFHRSLSACFIHLCSNIFSSPFSLFFFNSSFFYFLFFFLSIVINYPRTLYKPSHQLPIITLRTTSTSTTQLFPLTPTNTNHISSSALIS